MAPLLASLEVFHEAGISNLREKSVRLTNYLEYLIQENLNNKIEIITPSTSKDRGCQLSLRMIHPIENIMDKLHKIGIIADWREPDVIRIALFRGSRGSRKNQQHLRNREKYIWKRI